LFPTQLEIPNPKTERVNLIQSGYEFPRPEHCPQSMYDAQMAHFIQCIRKKKTPIPGAAEGLTNMKVVDAAYKSSRTGKVVEIR
jgi:predicted dehydrogenase